MCKEDQGEQARPAGNWAKYGADAGPIGQAKPAPDSFNLGDAIHTRIAQLKHEVAALQHLHRSLSLDALQDRRTFDGMVALCKPYR